MTIIKTLQFYVESSYTEKQSKPFCKPMGNPRQETLGPLERDLAEYRKCISNRTAFIRVFKIYLYKTIFALPRDFKHDN
jgi:hypothetical protein